MAGASLAMTADLRMRLALRVNDILEFSEHVHARQKLLQAPVRLALFSDGRDELAILTLSLSFNNDGPLGSFFRYICDNGTYKAFYDDLSDGKDNKIDVSKVDVSMDGIELEDREFIAAIKQKREPNGSLAQLLPCMHVLGKLEKIIDPQRKAHA